MKAVLVILFLFVTLSVTAQGPYAPAAGDSLSTAMHKDSSAFVDWATSCAIQRGLQDIANPNSDTTSVGSAAEAIGQANGSSVVSLGDGGIATLQFNGAIYNGVGSDFAVFENAFNASFLELAFVEVSSDGQNYYRFPAHSLTDTSMAVGSFGAVDPTEIHNLAGKYQANFGTPFDLEDLANQPGLDVQNITHVRIIDVVGTLTDSLARRDSQGRKINDQYPTPFPSGGFDLDAVGVVYLKTVGLAEQQIEDLAIYPNPVEDKIQLDQKWLGANMQLYQANGHLVVDQPINQTFLNLTELTSGMYYLRLIKGDQIGRAKIYKQ